MQFLPELWQLKSTTFHGLIHILIVGVPHQMILLFSMFQDGRELENFPMGRRKYNEADDIMKLVQRADNRGGESDREC